MTKHPIEEKENFFFYLLTLLLRHIMTIQGQGSQRDVVYSTLAVTNSTLVYEPKCGGGGYRVSANEYSCAHGAQINLGDLTPYLTYGTISLSL